MRESFSWDAWLARPECSTVLEGVARLVIRQAAGIGLPDGLLPCDPLQRLSPGELEDCVQATAHDLWVFLRTRPDAWKERTALQWLWGQGERFAAHRTARDYLMHLKDRARTHGVNPWRALYRRARQLLQEDGGIHYHATARGAYYSLRADGPDLEDAAVLRAIPYDRWESPLPVASAAELHRADRILDLARFFWRQAVGRLGGRECFLPVREMVHYLSRHYAHLAVSPGVSLAEQARPDSGDDAGEPVQAGAEQAPELAVVRSRLQDLAERLAASWTEKQRHAFYLLHGAGLTLEAAADRMGYKGASGARYVYRSALDRLRDFCLLWPGLSPPDLDDALFDEFVERVLALCKMDD